MMKFITEHHDFLVVLLIMGLFSKALLLVFNLLGSYTLNEYFMR